MITVACVFVRGEYPYTVEYVARLRAMVTRWLDRPFRFVCLTDQPEALPGDVEAIPIRVPAGCSAPWAKLELFHPRRAWAGRVLYLDLDTIIVRPLAELLEAAAPFVITDDPVGRVGKDAFGRRIVRRFNSSVMAWDGTETAVHKLYTAWRPIVAALLSGDQDWIGDFLPQAATWPRAWFPRLSECLIEASSPQGPKRVLGPIPAEARVVLCKVPKNHIAVVEHPRLAELWGAAA